MCKISASDTLKLYRHLLRLCASFSKTETLHFRDAADNTDVFLRFDIKGAAIRALSKWLRETKTDVSSDVHSEPDVHLHSTQLPEVPSTMRFTRSDLLNCVKRNFRHDSSNIQHLNSQQQDLAREMLGFRGLCLGVFLDSQINLHQMSSITTTSFQALLPAEMQSTQKKEVAHYSSSKGNRSLPMIAADEEGADDTAGHENTGAAEHLDIAQVAGQGQAGGSNSEAEAKHDLQRLQRRLDSVQEVYKGRNPLVGSANEFEALCMSALSAGDAQRGAAAAGDGADAVLVPKVARLRIHAVPFPVRTSDGGEADAVRGSGADEHMLFHNQIIIENIGDVAVQLMGRWHKVTAPWESKAFGDRSQPFGHASDGVLVMPTETVMEQQSMQIHGSEGEITGGFLCRVLPMDIAQDIARLYSPMKLKASGPVSMQSLDPDAYFLAEFGPCKIRSAQAVEGQFAQKLAASTDDSDDDSEDESGDEQHSEDEQETLIEVFADK